MPTALLNAWCKEVFGVDPEEYARPSDGTDAAPSDAADAPSTDDAAATPSVGGGGLPPPNKTLPPGPSQPPPSQPAPSQPTPSQPGTPQPGTPQANGDAALKTPTPECKPLRNQVAGPKHHVLCATHGHVYDETTGEIVADSVADYDKKHKIPRDMEPECKPLKGMIPGAPNDIVVCGPHGHVLDMKAGKIVANTRAMYLRAHPEYDTKDLPPIPDPPPSPVPVPPVPVPPIPPVPVPPIPPIPVPPVPIPPIPVPPVPVPPVPVPPTPTPFVPDPAKMTIISRDDLKALQAAVDATHEKVLAAIASEEEIAKASAKTGLDPQKPGMAGAAVDGIKKDIDPKDLEILAIIKEQVDNVTGDMQTLRIMAERGKKDLASLDTLKQLKVVDQKKVEEADKTAEHAYDACIQTIKFLVAIAQGDAFAVGGGVLELFGMDVLKDHVQAEVDTLTGMVNDTHSDLKKAVDGLNAFAYAEAQAIVEQLSEISAQLQVDSARWLKEVHRFLDKLDTLVAKSKDAKASQDYQNVVTFLKAVEDSHNQLRDAKEAVAKQKMLTDPVWTRRMVPLGQLIFEYPSDPGYVVYQNGGAQNCFTTDPNLGRAEVEAMAADLQRLQDLDKAAARVGDISTRWNEAIAARLGL